MPGAGIIEVGTDTTTLVPPYACPYDLRELTSSPTGYSCPGGHSFHVRGGIPRFVDSADYAEAFGRQWNRFRTTQLDSHTGLALAERRALRCIGLEHSNDNGPLLEHERILEVGCGAGRFTEVLLKHGALVTSVDLSSAVDANAVTSPPSERHRIAQADARALPFAPRQFDGVFCLGVVQHTPDPERTVAELYEQVRPGGWLAFDHYAFSLSTVTWVGMHAARRIFKRLPADRKLPAVERMVDSLLPLHAKVARCGRSPARVLSRVSPVLSYYHVHPELSPDLQRDWAVLDTHDALADAYKHHRRTGQLVECLSALGLEEIVVHRDGNGIEARGRRPSVIDGHG